MPRSTGTDTVLNRPLEKPPKRSRKVGSASDLRRTLWKAIRAMEDLFTVPDVTPTVVLRTAHALSQASGAYLRVLEMEDLERRIRALEEAQPGTPPHADP